VAHQYRLKPIVRQSRLDSALPQTLAFPQFNLITRVTQRDPQIWRKVTRYPATLQNLKLNDASATAKHLADVKQFSADVKQFSADVIGGPDNTLVGKLTGTFSENRLNYRFEWTGPEKTEVQEIGWAFAVPAECNRFSWDREARWTVYPEKHIGRPRGTAMPDTMNVPYTKMDRVDAYDFNSTKYDCNWASLTDRAGNGIRAEFDETQRFHCRGGVSEDGQHVLFVNQQVSPPDDLSTPVVRDLYMTFNPGDVIEGSFRIGRNTP
jgi:hypothetical protein